MLLGTKFLGKFLGKTQAGNEAVNCVNGIKLAKQLASEQQMGEAGTPIYGQGAGKTLRDAPRLSNEYGGNPLDWSKRSSTQYEAADGSKFETHWYENGVTGQRVEHKTIIRYHND